MRVLHLDTGREWRGGQQQVLNLTAGLAARGIESVVAAPVDSPLCIRLREVGLPVIPTTSHAPLHPRSLLALQRILRAEPWDLIHTHTAKAHTLAFLTLRLMASRSYRRPHLVVARRVDFTPGSDPFSRLKYTSPGQSFICVSDGVQRVLLRYGAPGRAVHVVHSGVEPFDPEDGDPAARRRALRDELGVPLETLLIGAIGQLVPHKGHTHLLSALASLRSMRAAEDWHAVILGEGPLLADLEAQQTRLGLADVVTFAGYRPGARRYLPAFDLYVSPSVEEGLGTSTLDASSAGLAVVATTAGGSAETVDPGTTGLLVPAAEPRALADAILTLLADHERRGAMGAAGREWIAARFSASAMVEGTLAVYREVLESA